MHVDNNYNIQIYSITTLINSKDLNNSTTTTTTTTTITSTVIILIKTIIITATTVITIKSTAIETNVFIILSALLIIEGKFAKLLKLFVKIIINKLITLISNSAAENIGNFYFKIINLYTFIKLIFIEEGNKFIFEIELFYILNYFKILYFITNFYSKINTIIFNI